MATYQEFAASVKKKYPEYAQADDRKLAEAMIKKHPEYAAQVSFDTVEQATPPQPPPEPTWSEVLFPGASESVAAGDPWYKQSGMALGDISSLPGRLVGGMAEGMATKAGYLGSDVPMEDIDKDAVSVFKGSMARGMNDEPDRNITYNIAHGIVSDPTLIPAMATGAGLAKLPLSLGKYTPAIAGLVAGMGYGATSRAYDPKGEVDSKLGMGVDAATGLIPAVGDIVSANRLAKAAAATEEALSKYGALAKEKLGRVAEGMSPKEVAEALRADFPDKVTSRNAEQGLTNMSEKPEYAFDINALRMDTRSTALPLVREDVIYHDKAVKQIDNIIDSYKKVHLSNNQMPSYEDATALQKLIYEASKGKTGIQEDVYNAAIDHLKDYRTGVAKSTGRSDEMADIESEILADYAKRHPVPTPKETPADPGIADIVRPLGNLEFSNAISKAASALSYNPGVSKGLSAATRNALYRTMTQGDADMTADILEKPESKQTFREKAWLRAKGY